VTLDVSKIKLMAIAIAIYSNTRITGFAFAIRYLEQFYDVLHYRIVILLSWFACVWRFIRRFIH
jgi:hypothetical protein